MRPGLPPAAQRTPVERPLWRRRAVPMLALLVGAWSGIAGSQPMALPGVSAAAPSRVSNPVMRADKTPGERSGPVSVWIDLDLPELASLPRGERAERDVMRSKISAQQDQVMARLRELGALEQARVQQLRNALAVRLAPAQFDAARRIPGVRAVRVVRHIERAPPVQRR